MIEKLISVKGCLKIRKYEISRELSLLNIHLNTESAIWAFFFFSNQTLKGLFHTNSYNIINEMLMN